MDKMIRIILGSSAIALVVAIGYGWGIIHNYIGLTAADYMYVIGGIVGLYLAYILGDLLLLSYKLRKEDK